MKILKNKTWLFLSSFLCLVGCQEANSTTYNRAVWSEFIPYAQVEQQLPTLKANGLSLFIAFHQSTPDYDGFAHLYTAAQKLGVEVRPWLLLNENQGYWFNKWNFRASEIFVADFLRHCDQRGIKPDYLIFDIEPPQNVVAKAEDDVGRADFIGLLHDLTAFSKDSPLSAAIASYQSLVNSLHSRGIKVHAVTSNFVLDDQNDTNMRIQSALGLPITGIDWDEISFMIYRADFMRIIGPVTSDIITRYADRAVASFGSRAGMDIGEAGHVSYPVPFEGYSDIDDLSNDANAAAASGIQNIHYYSLDGMSEAGVDHWLAPIEPKKPPFIDWKASAVLHTLDTLRLLLPSAN